MGNKERYREICKSNTDISIFAQPWWLDVVCNKWDVTLVTNGDKLAGAWAFPLEEKLGIQIFRTPKLTPYLGPQFFPPIDLKESNKDGFFYETLAELIKQLPDAKVWNIAMPPGLNQAGLFKGAGLQLHVQQTFLLKLTGSEKELLANMKESTRRNIRLAEGQITVTDSADSLMELYEFQKETLAKKGKKLFYTFDDMQRLMNACIANNSGALWTVKSGDKTECIVWQVWDNKCSYYLMGGQNPDNSNYRAMTYLLWYAIKTAKIKGLNTFDFEGSMDEGVERFFRNFGGERTLYIVLAKNKSLIWKLKQTLMG